MHNEAAEIAACTSCEIPVCDDRAEGCNLRILKGIPARSHAPVTIPKRRPKRVKRHKWDKDRKQYYRDYYIANRDRKLEQAKGYRAKAQQAERSQGR